MFTLQLIISFLAGGLFIALQTLIAERVPLRWRGITLTIPSTMALGIFFIGLTKTAHDVPEATTIIPAATGAVYIFVVIFSLLAKFGLALSLPLSVLSWGIYAFILLQFPPSTFLNSILYGIPIFIITYLIIRRLPQVSRLKQYPMNWKHIILRSLISGSIVTLIVILSKTLGNIWGGLFSVFPAVYTSTFIIYYYLQGKQAIPAVAKTLFLPGIPGFIIYAYITSITFPIWGIWLGTLAAYAATFMFFCTWRIFTPSSS